MKMYDEINGFKKEYVYERYTRIVYDSKDYDIVTKNTNLDIQFMMFIVITIIL